jgi:GT2 family glycosyltransferase
MELSIIIVSYNVRHFLEQCLNSVRKASRAIECELFVVDNNSADGSCSMVSREFPEARLIINHTNRGFSAANNQALRLAKGRYILLLNPDTMVEEETFTRCISFMDSHPDAGALGVRMINGKGRFLPESKRGLPTPRTAFFKITGLSGIFPKSGLINRYYLGNLDSMQTAEAAIISGAFMFLRGEAVASTGYFDEDYFLYGEDVDYSHRLLQAGFRNYYFPETSIIHFKGESTKKGDLDVFINFYRAMLIFVRKHLNNGKLKNFIFLIKTAIFISAGLTLLKQFGKKFFLPVTEGFIIYLIFRIFTSLWGTIKFGAGYDYPDNFIGILIPIYSFIMLFSIAVVSGYRIPAGPGRVIKGIIAGTLIILIIYALLPLNLRFSRAIIIFSGLILLAALPLLRILISLLIPSMADNPFSLTGRTLIVSGPEGYARITDLMTKLGIKNRIAGRVSISPDDFEEEVLGSIDQIKEVIRINRIKEIIFTTSELTASQIIDNMHLISKLNVSIKIATAGDRYIIGSQYVNPRDSIIPASQSSFIRKTTDLLKKISR